MTQLIAAEQKQAKNGRPFFRANYDGKWATSFNGQHGAVLLRNIGKQVDIKDHQNDRGYWDIDAVTEVEGPSQNGSRPSLSRDAHIGRSVALKAAVDYSAQLTDAERNVENVILVAGKFASFLEGDEQDEFYSA